MSLNELAQLTVAGLINGSVYALLGVSFALILGVTGRFHYAYALVYTLAAYTTSLLESPVGASWPLAWMAGMAAAIVAGVAVEIIVYRPLARASGVLSLLTIFIASLGVTIAGVNLLTLLASAQSRAIEGFAVKPISIGSVTFTSLDVTMAVTFWLLIVLLAVLLRYTALGRAIKAARGNPDLARIVGIDPRRVYVSVFALGSLLCGVTAIFSGMRFAVVSDMGNRPVMFAFVVAFLGGTQRSPLVVGVAGLLIGLAESLSGLWVSSQWSSLVVFTVLFLYLALRPLDLRSLRRALVGSVATIR